MLIIGLEIIKEDRQFPTRFLHVEDCNPDVLGWYMYVRRENDL